VNYVVFRALARDSPTAIEVFDGGPITREHERVQDSIEPTIKAGNMEWHTLRLDADGRVLGRSEERMRAWLYQCNPDESKGNQFYYSPQHLRDELDAGDGALQDWPCQQHFRHVQPGDPVVIFFSGDAGGIEAVGRIEAVRPRDRKHSEIDIRLDVRRSKSLLKNPVPRDTVVSMGLIKNRRHTVQDISGQWAKVSSIFGARRHPLSAVQAVVPPPDFEKPPGRVATNVLRVIRDTERASDLKRLYDYRCQACSARLVSSEGAAYAEAHHLRPLGAQHRGKDNWDNMVVLCPNHHALFDCGAIAIDPRTLRLSHVTKQDRCHGRLLRMVKGHSLSHSNLNYHLRGLFVGKTRGTR